MTNERSSAPDGDASPDSSAVRVALWRAMHTLVDPPPHVLVDELGLRLADPPEGWQQRPDMHPARTARNRASIVARARFVDDLVAALAEPRGASPADGAVGQYVVLGAGLDTFAQRHPVLLGRLRVYEVDQPATQRWKQARLAALGLATPPSLRFVPVDLEGGDRWGDALATAGFDPTVPTLVSSLGVAVYLTRTAVEAMLRDVAALGPAASIVLSFMVPLDDVAAEERPALDGAVRGAAASGTPWISFFRPDELAELARAAGLGTTRHVSPDELADRYFAGRADGLRPSSAEHVLVASR